MLSRRSRRHFYEMTKTPPEEKKKVTKKRILNSAYGLVMTEILNGRQFKGGAAGKGAAPPRMAPQRCGGVAKSFPILQSSY